MEYTKNLKLSKPSYDDDVDIQVLNNNMDILDDKISKVRNYLPLTGGTMTGNITLPFEIGLNYDTNHWVNFDTTNFKGVRDTTLCTKANRFKFYTPSSKEFVIQDDGVYWNGKSLLTTDDKGDMSVIKESKLSYGTGYTKLNNGLLLQWGYFNPTTVESNSGDDGSGDSTATAKSYKVTLPLPFADTGYAVFTNRSNTNNDNMSYLSMNDGCLTAKFTTTSFYCGAFAKKYNQTIQWFAIGKGVL